MKKLGLKTFIYSFVFSLFVVFFINGLYWRGQSLNSRQIKISNKNITLFLKEERKLASSAKVIPVKKIALSIAKKEPEPQNNSFEGDLIPLLHDQNKDEEPILVAASSDIIPLDINPSVIAKPKKLQKKFSDPPLPKDNKEVIVANFDTFINSPPPIEAERAPVAINVDKPITQNIKVAKIKSIEDDGLLLEKKEELVLAYNDSISEKDQAPLYERKNEETRKPKSLLIPIEKNYSGERVSDNKIQVISNTDQKQIALAPGNIPIKSMTSDDSTDDEEEKIVIKKAPEKNTQWKKMSDKSKDNKWLVAKGIKYPKNNTVLDNDFSSETDENEIRKVLSSNRGQDDTYENIELASGTVKNLLIPIPDEILNDENLTPQLVSSKASKALEEELTQKELTIKNVQDEQKKIIQTTPMVDNNLPSVKENNNSKAGLIDSISSIFTGSKDAANAYINGTSENGIIKNIKNKFSTTSKAGKILPTEIRLSFQPGKAEISGQTLRWIQAFSNKTIEEPTVALEIRIDGTSSQELQQKRLNLLHNILTNKGVEYSKIKIVFTSREPNSFIIRTIRVNNNTTGDIDRNNMVKQNNNYMQW